MASYNVPGANGSGDMESNANIQSLLAQLRRQRAEPEESADQAPAAGPNALSQFNPYAHGGHSFYGQGPSESPHENNYDSSMDSPAFPPAAPTPPVGFGQSHFPPSMLNPTGTARGVSGDERTSQLLNLLKFSGQSHGSQPGPQPGPQYSQQPQNETGLNFSRLPPPQNIIHAPAPAAADPTGLLAALMKGNMHTESAPVPKPEPEPPAPATWNATSPSSDTQQYLLNLLNRPKPSQNDVPPPSEPTQSMTLTPKSTSEFKENLAKGSYDDGPDSTPAQHVPPHRSSFDFEPSHVSSPPKLDSTPRSQQGSSASKQGQFAYHNPFEDLSASSPLRAPNKSTTPGGSATGPSATGATSNLPIHILKKPNSASPTQSKRSLSQASAADAPDYSRRKMEVSASPLSHHIAEQALVATAEKETVSEAVSDLAKTVDEEAREAVARAEHEQAQAEIAKDLDEMMNARTDREFEESAHIAAQAIKKELDKDENRTILESTLDPDVAKAVRDIVDEAAQAGQGPVADSWESAEAEDNEIVVLEETTSPVKVYNFPMKPWIAITVQDSSNEPRPLFREEAILEIARLKKDFDQIDRNLVTASENYMAYGMSKAGGLRVIRQYDGKDAKLFTDTKDRIFNVAMSLTPADQLITPKEAIIGTGISGTVYWVQIKNGEKDHLEDAHLEQYGFALPPINTQEGGDAPGGVLKTRARAPSTRPEFFAVGRGKFINIIWPSFILENNLFKPGHDRVVDTEKLFKHCSLKINTGKAGKDFAFSQDDTTVVSLDKSGRVKFWDVRDLTAAEEGSDSRNPRPAQTSLEIREPLLTLTTTPDGEKAWPTSVLLLDKLRPYQKRTALRYMVVGMKQNHTLQLWDLALGKAVQEFNLPHSKESDAVCSVLYHPPTGMIVVGHPTRNSIYFLHLSAPKYSLKNISQVDYIQRLVAQDSSIPQPESTAVISGIREYSFGTGSVLRSLDILQNPASSTDGDEPTLFELYAMHSKGVRCIHVKQAELGWGKDNKVLNPIDAVEVGLVKIDKLPQITAASTIDQTVPEAPAAQTRLATRNAKDSLQKTPSSQGEEKKASESATPAKLAEQRKEDDTPIPTASEKSEKNRRKKRANAAATPVDREPPHSNGGSNNSPLAKPTSAAAKDTRTPPSTTPAISDSISRADLEDLLHGWESTLTASMSSRVEKSLKEVLVKSDQQSRASQVEFRNSQASLLQVVSSTLSENVEKVLKDIILRQFEAVVIPNIRDTIDQSVSDHFLSKLNSQLSQAIQKEMQRALPHSVGQAFQKQEVVRSVADKVAQFVLPGIEEEVVKALNSHILPSVTTAAAQAAQRTGSEVLRQLNTDMEQLERLRRADLHKIDQLVAQTTELTNIISTMATSQAQFQKEFLTLKQQLHDLSHAQARESAAPGSIHPPAQRRNSGSSHGFSGSVGSRDVGRYDAQQPQHSQPRGGGGQELIYAPTNPEQREQMELQRDADTIDKYMKKRQFDEAIIYWLQSGKEQELFNQVLVKYPPAFLDGLAPLLLLSIGANVSGDLQEPNLVQKLAWTEMVLLVLRPLADSLDNQVREVTPRIVGNMQNRLEELFVRISKISPQDPVLKNITNMASVAIRINQTVASTSARRQLQDTY